MKEKKPIYKRAWFWVIVLFFAIPATFKNKEVVEEVPPTPKVTIPAEYQSALNKAQSYADRVSMSKRGIFKQLTSRVEGFSKKSAQYAIDHVSANWYINALYKAKDYQSMDMSPSAIRNQLTSFIEGFTLAQANYAIKHLNDT